MKAAFTHDPEQLAAVAAAPFLFVQGRLRRRGGSVTEAICGGGLYSKRIRRVFRLCSYKFLGTPQRSGRKTNAKEMPRSGLKW
jgi:hypothetical protein